MEAHEHAHDTRYVDLADSQQDASSKLRKLAGSSLEDVYGREAAEKAFSALPKKVVCIDERARVNGAREAVIGLAGSGVLMNDSQRAVFLKNVSDAGIDLSDLEITEHGCSCGACGIYCNQNPGNDVAEMAKKSAGQLAQMAGSQKKVTSIGWDQACDYKAVGFENAHHARAIYVDGTGRFNPESLGMPDGFILSAKYTEGLDDYANTELGIAVGIATGDHGLGEEYFRQDSNGPLTVVLIGDCPRLEERFQPTLSILGNKPVNIVRVDR